MKQRLAIFLQRLADLWVALWPRQRPQAERLAACRLVSHRGEHDNRNVFENTLAAFEQAVNCGAWGIEFDLQWTRDLEPVVIHDVDARRVFDASIEIGAIELAELRRRLPLVPTLVDVVETFGGRCHLMVELKGEPGSHDAIKAERLQAAFAGLRPATDYHLLALDAALLAPCEFAGPAAQLLVAEYNVRRLSQQVSSGALGGLCGHYLMLTSALIERHHANGQAIGTGFASSRNGLYREVARGVDWIFTNHTARLGRHLD